MVVMSQFINVENISDEVLYYDSPIGTLEICGTEEYIKSVLFFDSEKRDCKKVSQLLNTCVQQLDEYFNKKRKKFYLPLQPQGTDFQKAVWDALLEVPYGATVSYFDVATKVGNPKAVRAVGGANGKNPITIIIPCHRIIGSNGKLVGYGGGLWRKKWLLQHEQNLLA